MKRKLFITLTLALFAVGAVITTNVAQNDISLEDIRVMAMADHTTDDPEGAVIICNQSPEGEGLCWTLDLETDKCVWSGTQRSSCVN